jgi:Protein of unknown function (DUF2917)
MEYQATVLKTLDLASGTLVPFSSTRGERVRVLSGRVWLTEEGDVNDALLGNGQEIALGGHGLAVIEALSPARVQLLQSQSAWDIARSSARTIARRISALWLRPFRQPGAASSKERALAQALAQFDGSLGLVQRVKVQAGCAGRNEALA